MKYLSSLVSPAKLFSSVFSFLVNVVKKALYLIESGMAFGKVCLASGSENWGEKRSGFHMILEHNESQVSKTVGRERHVTSMVLHEWLPLPALIFRHDVTDGGGIRRKVT